MTTQKKIKKGLATACPACGTDITFRKLPRRGNYVTCRNCESLLEVVRLAPLTLEWAFEEPLGDSYDQPTDFDFRANGRRFLDREFEPEEVSNEWDAEWDEHWRDNPDE